MASLKELKQRMVTVKAIQKISASLKMVASAKLKGAQNLFSVAKPYSVAATAALNGKVDDLKLLEEDQKQQFVMACNADRGLCGSVNSSVNRFTKELIEKNPQLQSSVVTCGTKAKTGLTRLFGKQFVMSVNDVSKKDIYFSTVVPVVEALLKQPYDRLQIVCNRFVNALTFETRSFPILNYKTLFARADLDKYELEGERDEVLEALYEHHLSGLLYNVLVENSLVEISRRMVSMEGAFKSATDMLARLNLRYNRQRQAAITSEIMEIVCGAEAVKQSSN